MKSYGGVDPSITNTGLCVLSDKGELVAVTQTANILNSLKGDPYYDIKRYRELSNYVVDFLQSHGVTNVGYENYSYNSTNKAFTVGEYGGVLKLALVEAGLGITLVEPRRLKKFATGMGSASKQDMVGEAKRQYPNLETMKGLSHDICDAVFLAKVAWYVHEQENVPGNDKDVALIRPRYETIKQLLR